MIDAGTPDLGAEAPSAEGTFDEGQPDFSATESVDVAATETVAERLDFDAYGNHVVSVKVDGQETEVPLRELRDGWMRQSDYTKKTQEVAQMRKRLTQAEALAAALERNPEATIQSLAQHLGINLGGADEAVAFEEMSPQEQRLARLEAEQARAANAALQAQIENEFKTLEDQFGEIDRDEVVAYAIQNGLTVTKAYRDMAFDRIFDENKRLSEEQQALEAKRGTQVVARGGGAQRGALSAPPPGKNVNSIWDAFEAAKRQIRA